MDIITKVWRGDAGLARTYWLFGVAACFLLGIPLGSVRPGSLPAVALAAVFGAYLWWVNMGIWRASNKYAGPAIWSGLAKIAVVVSMLFVGVIASSVVSALSSQDWNKDRHLQEFDPDFWKKGGTPVN